MTLLEAVTVLARLGGDRAKASFGAAVAVETKGDGSPVTEVDRDAERAMRAWLEAHFPDDGIVGEELGEARAGAKRRWFLDPIDGTRAFVRGVPLWGTLVGVAEGERVLAGAIYLPALGELVCAERGQGCWWNGQRARVSSTARLADAAVLTTELRTLPAEVERLCRRAAVSRTWGDCYGYVLVATGRADVMVDPVMNAWDAVALQPIIEEAGGVFTDRAGRPTAFGGSVIASNAALARELGLVREPPPPLELAALPAADALVTVVAQHARTGEVLMVAHADREALERTLATGEMHYRSRTRGPWHKGATSGNVQRVESLHFDCDRDALLARVLPAGPACHTFDRSCFHDAPAPEPLAGLDAVIAQRATSPGSSYTQRLLGDRNLRLKKIGEEATELVMALAERDQPRIAEEAADVVYHLLVALRAEGLGLDAVREVLKARAR